MIRWSASLLYRPASHTASARRKERGASPVKQQVSTIDQEVIALQAELQAAREGHAGSVDAVLDAVEEGDSPPSGHAGSPEPGDHHANDAMPTEAEIYAATQEAMSLEGDASSDDDAGEAASAFAAHGFDSDSDREGEEAVAAAPPRNPEACEESPQCHTPPAAPVGRPRAASAMKGKSGRKKKVGGLRFADELVEVPPFRSRFCC